MRRYRVTRLQSLNFVFWVADEVSILDRSLDPWRWDVEDALAANATLARQGLHESAHLAPSCN